MTRTNRAVISAQRSPRDLRRACLALLVACAWLSGCEQKAPPAPTEDQSAKAQASAQPAAPAGAGRPTIVFVLFDTLRADRVGVRLG